VLVQSPPVQSPKSGLRASDLRPWTLDLGLDRKYPVPTGRSAVGHEFGGSLTEQKIVTLPPVKVLSPLSAKVSGPDFDRSARLADAAGDLFLPQCEKRIPTAPGILFLSSGRPPRAQIRSRRDPLSPFSHKNEIRPRSVSQEFRVAGITCCPGREAARGYVVTRRLGKDATTSRPPTSGRQHRF
jgi:hypothetical protein